LRFPKKRGSMGTNRQGRIMLTNPEGESVGVHVAVAYIWEHSDGRTPIQDIAKMLVKELEIPVQDQDAESDNVALAMRSLEKKDLIEYVQNR
jgi:methyltransferase-like protein